MSSRAKVGLAWLTNLDRARYEQVAVHISRGPLSDVLGVQGRIRTVLKHKLEVLIVAIRPGPISEQLIALTFYPKPLLILLII